jgi:hypothetical protein
MKTIALKEKTFQILEELKKKEKAESYDELIKKLVIEPCVPKSMFGALKGKIRPFTSKERKEIWADKYREI